VEFGGVGSGGEGERRSGKRRRRRSFKKIGIDISVDRKSESDAA
jgi:hypothetical protein